MGLLQRLTGMFTRGGRDDGLLLQGLEHAKAKRPEKAIEVYNQLLNSGVTSDTTRARRLQSGSGLLFAGSRREGSGRSREGAALPNLPENVQSAARTQIARVRRRNKEPA